MVGSLLFIPKHSQNVRKWNHHQSLQVCINTIELGFQSGLGGLVIQLALQLLAYICWFG